VIPWQLFSPNKSLPKRKEMKIRSLSGTGGNSGGSLQSIRDLVVTVHFMWKELKYFSKGNCL